MDARARREYKKGLTSDDGRRRREERSQSIRKDKKEERLTKRRNFASALADYEDVPLHQARGEGPPPIFNEAHLFNTPYMFANRKFTTLDIPILMKGLQGGSAALGVVCMSGFRKLLSAEINPPVQECVDCGALPIFVGALKKHHDPNLQYEALWALANIASTERTGLVLESGALPSLIQLLKSPVAYVREQAALCLGNIAGENYAFRDMVLCHKALEPLLQNIVSPESVGLLRTCVWTLSNFCGGKPPPPADVLTAALPAVARVILNSSDEETVVEAVWALSYISEDGDSERIQSIINLDLIPSLVSMLHSDQSPKAVPALKCLGNVVSGIDQHTHIVHDVDILSALVPYLRSGEKETRKQVCGILASIAAGQDELARILKTPDLLSLVLDQMSVSAEWDVNREAIWVVFYIATLGQHDDVMCLVRHGAVRPVCDVLGAGDPQSIQLAMDIMEAILKAMDVTELTQEARYLVEECGGVEKLENLQEHDNEDVYRRAVNILENYFDGEEVTESENVAPYVTSLNTYSFGLPDEEVSVKALAFCSGHML
jgi:HEAT repeat protein